MNPPSDLLEQALAAMQHAYAPYSQLKVGACIRALDGQLFNGCNVENTAYNLCLCAESNAISTMVNHTHGQSQIQEVLVTSSSPGMCTPCGACRQRLIEFADKTTQVHLYSSTGAYQCLSLGELLPHPFNNDILG